MGANSISPIDLRSSRLRGLLSAQGITSSKDCSALAKRLKTWSLASSSSILPICIFSVMPDQLHCQPIRHRLLGSLCYCIINIQRQKDRMSASSGISIAAGAPHSRKFQRMPFTSTEPSMLVLDEFAVKHSIAFDFDSLFDCRFHRVSLLLLCDAGRICMALPIRLPGEA